MQRDERLEALAEETKRIRRYNRRMRWFAIIVAVAVVAAGQAPWDTVTERLLKRQLENAGVTGLDFRVREVGFSSVTLSEIAYQGQALQSLALAFHPLELLRGGLGQLQASEMALKFGDVTVGLKAVDVQFPPRGVGEGSWRMDSIEVRDAPLLVPMLTGSGTLSLAEEALGLKGRIASADGHFIAGFSLEAPRHTPQEAVLTLERVELPWNGGTLAVHHVKAPLAGTEPVALKLELKNVSLDMLLKQAVGGAAKATGEVTGVVPMRIGRDGTLYFGEGELGTGGEGVIQLPPTIIPGDQPQVEQVREMLSNFHYDRFVMGVEGQKGKKLSILLSLQGHNPDVYNGREIHLNVRLNGDLLSLLSQSLSVINDPQQLIPQE